MSRNYHEAPRLERPASLTAISRTAWDPLARRASPFFEHAFLAGLESAGCVGPGTGWAPRPLLLHGAHGAVAAAAAYEKHDSQGEFIFDWAWADAAHRAGIRYYPKLVVASPFSPVGGPRLLVGDAPPEAADALRGALVDAAVETARALGHSGVHALFLEADEVPAFTARGFVERHGVQFHWQSRGERTFDDFLGRFDAKKRHQIRRERRLVREAGVTVEVLTGDALGPELAPLLHTLYGNTVDKFAWGRRYLNLAFFTRLLEAWRDRLLVLLARVDGRVVGGTVNGLKDGVLYGRYWGAAADIPFLHFEVCSYAAIEACIERGLTRFEAGAGGGEHKAGRGFEPTRVRSAHRLFHGGLHRAVDAFVTAERASLAEALGEVP